MMNYFNYLRPTNLPIQVADRSILLRQREIILQRVLNILLLLYTVMFPLILIFNPQIFRSGKPGYYVLPYIGLAFITVVRSINYTIRAFIVIIALQLLGLSALVIYGLSGTGIIFLIGAAVLANLFFCGKLGGLSALISLIIISAVGILMAVTQRLPLPKLTPMESSGSIWEWVTAAAVYLFIMALIMGAIGVVIRGLTSALKSQEKLTGELEAERNSLEIRVKERSADLIKRVDQFEIASQIAREIAGETNLDGLLDRSVNLVHDRFDFYYVALFISDDKDEYAVLRAGTGEAGRAMLDHNHRLKIGEVGMVGYVISRGEARIALDVATDAVHYKNPYLPDTRSEMALPLRMGERVIGALDVQSTTPGAFSHEDVRILQTIADQLAIAFEKTRLVNQLKQNVDELENTDRSNTQKAWRTHLRNTRQKLAYAYHNDRLESRATDTEQAQEARAKGQAILKVVPSPDNQGQPVTVLAVPIKLRNQVLGVVDIHFNSTHVSPDLISLIEGTVNRLAVSLENARLLEEIQYRAERERMVSEISSKVRAAADVDSVMRIAIQEIGQSLGVAEVMVQLRKEI